MTLENLKQAFLLNNKRLLGRINNADNIHTCSIFSNPNLLDNWYFVDPINQRGQNEYVGIVYGIDRWINSSNGNGKITLTENGILLGPNVVLDQRIEPKLLHAGQLVTLSVLVGNMLYSYTKTLANASWGMFELGGGLYGRVLTQDGVYGVCSIATPAEYTGTTPVRAVKLELGSQQTLAHQDTSGNWVLNDPPPNKALELVKCQRYYQPIPFYTRLLVVYNEKSFTDALWFGSPMRTTSTLINPGAFAGVTSGMLVTPFRLRLNGISLGQGQQIEARGSGCGLSSDL